MKLLSTYQLATLLATVSITTWQANFPKNWWDRPLVKSGFK